MIIDINSFYNLAISVAIMAQSLVTSISTMKWKLPRFDSSYIIRFWNSPVLDFRVNAWMLKRSQQ